MRKVLGTLLAVVALSLSAETLQQFDAKLVDELTALDPGAVDIWNHANTARAAGQHEAAAKLYADVYQRVPKFVHALRRQAGEEIYIGRRDLALTHSREAVKIERSAENLARLAEALVVVKNGKATDEDLQEAKKLSLEAVAKKPGDGYPHSVLARVAVMSNDFELLKRETERLEVLQPKTYQTYIYRVNVAASEGDWSEAFAALERARQFGLPADDYNEIRRELRGATPFYVRWWKPAAMGLAIWFGGFAVLLIAGAILSRVALRAARKPPQQVSQNATGLSSVMRRLYSAVLFLSCIFYYASIPIVIE